MAKMMLFVAALALGASCGKSSGNKAPSANGSAVVGSAGSASGAVATGSATPALAANEKVVTVVGSLQLIEVTGPGASSYVVRDKLQSFSLPFATKPDLSPMAVMSAGGDVEGAQAFAENDALAITLVRLPLPATDGKPLDAAGLKIAYDGMRDQGAANLGGKVIEDEDVKFGELAARRVAVRVESQAQGIMSMQWLIYQPSQLALYMVGATYREADAARVGPLATATVAKLQIKP